MAICWENEARKIKEWILILIFFFAWLYTPIFLFFYGITDGEILAIAAITGQLGIWVIGYVVTKGWRI